MTKNKIINFYYYLYLIRSVEEKIAGMYHSDKIKSPVHLSIGQEAISVGVCRALMPKDIVFGTYRGHAMYLAKGGDLKKMIAELYGKKDGCAKGKGGSMHLVDAEKGIMGTSAIVGTTLPISVGYAYSLKLKRSSNIVVSFFGDGATDEGVFHESMNFAALKKLPILFVCENNLYAIHSHYLRRNPLNNICLRARSYGMNTTRICESDVFKINDASNNLINGIRSGNGPAFMECLTYRWKEHVGPGDDFNLGYRNNKEMRPWVKNDPLARLGKLIPEAKRKSIQGQINNKIINAFISAEQSKFPRLKELYTEVFK